MEEVLISVLLPLLRPKTNCRKKSTVLCVCVCVLMKILVRFSNGHRNVLSPWESGLTTELHHLPAVRWTDKRWAQKVTHSSQCKHENLYIFLTDTTVERIWTTAIMVFLLFIINIWMWEQFSTGKIIHFQGFFPGIDITVLMGHDWSSHLSVQSLAHDISLS